MHRNFWQNCVKGFCEKKRCTDLIVQAQTLRVPRKDHACVSTRCSVFQFRQTILESTWSHYGENIGHCFAIACHFTFLKENVQCVKASETFSKVKAFEATFKKLYPASNFQRTFSVIFIAEATARVRTMVLIKQTPPLILHFLFHFLSRFIPTE